MFDNMLGIGKHLPFILAGLAIVYFFFLAPQQKQEEQANSFMKSLKIGDEVVTIGGLHGTIVDLQEEQVVLMGQGKTQFLLEKQALSTEATQKYYRKEKEKVVKKKKKKK